MTTFNIETGVAQEIVQKAIFESLDQNARELLIADAIKQLTLRPPKERNGYGYSTPEPRSPLEQAFDRAVTEVCNQVVREYLSDAEVKAGIERQIFAALDKVVQDKGTWLYDHIGSAVGVKIAEVLGGDN